MPTLADGSSAQDSRPRVEIDLQSARDRWRYKCENNHTTWEPTDGGIWCRSCANLGLDPHYTKLLDIKRHELVQWADVVVR